MAEIQSFWNFMFLLALQLLFSLSLASCFTPFSLGTHTCGQRQGIPLDGLLVHPMWAFVGSALCPSFSLCLSVSSDLPLGSAHSVKIWGVASEAGGHRLWAVYTIDLRACSCVRGALSDFPDSVKPLTQFSRSMLRFLPSLIETPLSESNRWLKSWKVHSSCQSELPGGGEEHFFWSTAVATLRVCWSAIVWLLRIVYDLFNSFTTLKITLILFTDALTETISQ